MANELKPFSVKKLVLVDSGDGVHSRYIAPAFVFTYRNHRGVSGVRRVQPISVRYGTTEWHPEPQWLMRAFDLDKDAEREFAMSEIAPASSTPSDDGWQPIETAPKDGTHAEEWWPVSCAPSDTWLRTRREGEDGENVCSLHRIPKQHGGGEEWVERDTGVTTITHGSFASPTHWHPLSAPPKGDAP